MMFLKLTRCFCFSQSRREELGPAIAAEVAAARHGAAELAREIEAFRTYFLKTAPFRVPGGAADLGPGKIDEAFSLLDSLALGSIAPCGSLPDLTARAAAEREHRALLEMASASLDAGDKLQLCQDEISALRLLWEEAAAVVDTLSALAARPWASVDVDAVMEVCKKKAKDLRALPRGVREYEAYRALEERVKGLTLVLPLLKDLAHPAMRARHWAALAQVRPACNVYFFY